jgi:1-acyl-sn-glycerol-3-phosphate acyltransferase
MFYSFLKVLVRFTLKIFFRKIFITGIEHIKSGTPQLIASNHPNGFLEPLIMACFFPKPLHFLVRGDVFDNPLLKPLLKSTNQIPIYRFRDGFSKLRENSQKMDESIQILLDKKNLLIFAEGGTESIKKLRPLQKGISRIAFHTLEKDPDLDIEILPVGINFTFPSLFNEGVMLNIGTPLKVRDYLNQYNQDNKSGHESLLNDLFLAMKKSVIHIEDQKRLKTFEKLVVFQRSHNMYSYLPVYLNDIKPLKSEKKLAESIDTLSDGELQEIREKIKVLESEMKNENVSLDDFGKMPYNASRIIILLIGFLPALLGGLLHVFPLAISFYFTKTNVKQKEFRASILMVTSMILCLLLYIAYVIIIAMTAIPFYWLAISILSGLWFRFYYQIWLSTTFVSVTLLDKLKNKGYQILNNL